MKKHIAILCLSLCAAFEFSVAAVKMPSIFSDNMMLQRDMPVKIWGAADANAKVDVDFGGKRKSTKAAADGKWSLFIDGLPADKNPREMTIYENGKVGKKIGNVIVGEVWILGGQSNMSFPVSKTSDFEKAKAGANNSEIRYFRQNTWNLSKTAAEDCDNGQWIVVSHRNVGNVSGVGFYFAEKLRADLKVPVGMVLTSLGAAKMIAFTPPDKVSNLKYAEDGYKDFLEKNSKYSYGSAMKAWNKKISDWKTACEKARSEKKSQPPRPKFEPNKISYLPPFATPCYLYNAVVAPVAGFGAKGVLWYQGESDSSGKSLDCFSEQFENLVNAWREKFGNDDLYFLTVQLASFGIKERDWPLARWKQYLSANSVPKCFMASIIDCGEKDDIHPRDKLTVASRLEKIALREVYGFKKVKPYGPLLKTVKYTPDYVEIAFDLDGQKLVGKGAARGFELKLNGEWKPANAELRGSKVAVFKAPNSNEKISGVRYLWSNWALPDVWLFNSENLPAAPFIDVK